MKLTTPNISHLSSVIAAISSETSFPSKAALYRIIEDIKFPDSPIVRKRFSQSLANKQTNYTPIANWLQDKGFITLSGSYPRYTFTINSSIKDFDPENIDPNYSVSFY